MLKSRIITTMLWNGTTLVKGSQFDNSRRAGSPITTIKIYNNRDVDEILFLDIEKTKSSLEGMDINFYKELTDECDVPITIGGGINKISDIDDLLFSGADKILINSSLYSNPGLLNDSANKFGSQTIVVGIDFKKVNGKYLCVKNSGKNIIDKDPLDWAGECYKRGAGEIVLTSVDKDGLMEGYDNYLINQISSKINIPIIASGGAGNYNHMFEALRSGASAVAAASIYHFTEQTPAEAKRFLEKKNINVRKS
tara:strand:+ start:95 stop:853 length:759 start_codon:yes stop_codon:yes gene_type:complete